MALATRGGAVAAVAASGLRSPVGQAGALLLALDHPRNNAKEQGYL